MGNVASDVDVSRVWAIDRRQITGGWTTLTGPSSDHEHMSSLAVDGLNVLVVPVTTGVAHTRLFNGKTSTLSMIIGNNQLAYNRPRLHVDLARRSPTSPLHRRTIARF